MEKVCLRGCEGLVVPYDHPPPLTYKPVPGRYAADEFLAYDVTKDCPIQLIEMLSGEACQSLTRQKLACLPLPEARPTV